MPYEVLEKKIKALPQNYYNELIDFLEYLTQKVSKENNQEDSLKKMRESSLQTVWESVKNDTW